MLTARQVADRLQVHRDTVLRWLERKELRGSKLGNRAGWRISESDLQQFLKERQP